MAITFVGSSTSFSGGNTTRTLTPHASTLTEDWLLNWTYAADASPGLISWDQTLATTGFWTNDTGQSTASQYGTGWQHHVRESGETTYGFENMRGGVTHDVMMTFRGMKNFNHRNAFGGSTGIFTGLQTWTITAEAHTHTDNDHLLIYQIWMQQFSAGTVILSVTPDAAVTTIYSAAPAANTYLYLGYEVVTGGVSFPARTFTYNQAGTAFIHSSRERINSTENETGYL